MRRRLLASLSATAAVAASLLIGSAVPATAADTAVESSSATADRSSGVTPNAKLPEAIRVDETKFKIVATLRGVGKQVYDCEAGAYKFREPIATLSTLRGAPAGIHGAGPFWANFDGSKFIGTGAISAPSPVDPDKNYSGAEGREVKHRRHGWSVWSVQQRGDRPAHRHQGWCRTEVVRRSHGRRGLLHDLRVLGAQVVTASPMRRRDDSSRRRIAMSGPALTATHSNRFSYSSDVP